MSGTDREREVLPHGPPTARRDQVLRQGWLVHEAADRLVMQGFDRPDGRRSFSLWAHVHHTDLYRLQGEFLVAQGVPLPTQLQLAQQKSPIRLRGYQETAIEGLRQGLRALKQAGLAMRIVLLAPTGAGKTVMCASIIRDAVAKGKRVVVVVHRQILVEQTLVKLAAAGVQATVVMGDKKSDAACQVQVCSLPTLASWLGQGKALPAADLVFYDECHHSMSDTARQVLESYRDSVLVGATATPWRTDKLRLGDVWGTSKHSMVLAPPGGVRELTRMGNLTPYEPYSYGLPDLSEVEVSKSSGDYNQDQLAAALAAQKVVGKAAAEYHRHTPGKRGLVFPVSVADSRQAVTEFEALGYKAAHIDCETPIVERARLVAEFCAGRVQVLSSVGVLTEGFDAPPAEVLMDCRPTKSLSLFMQKLGRVLRSCCLNCGSTEATWLDVTCKACGSANVKRKAIIHDHAGNLVQHGFPDDERDYSLTATPPQTKALHTCPACFWVFASLKDGGKCPKCDALLAEQVAREVAEAKAREAAQPLVVDGKRLDRKKIEELREKMKAIDGAAQLSDLDIFRVLHATTDEKAAELRRLRDLAERQGRREGWARHCYRRTFGVWPNGPILDRALEVPPATQPFIAFRPRGAYVAA